MGLSEGLKYNLRGLWFGIKKPKLLFLGIIRFLAIIIITILAASLILVYHKELLGLVWNQPESYWILWLWYLLSWLVTFFLVVVSGVLSYLLAQILFSVIIMDYMSRITEKILTGNSHEEAKLPVAQLLLYLIKQEIPRTFLPVLLSLALMILGWLTPAGPLIAILSSCLAVIFLAWDNTDLVPARRMVSFRERFRFLFRNILFHFGFGLPFLIPGLNILFLSFAPVGATIHYYEKHDQS
ncbi:CysZ protein [Desulfosarcina sp. BuS5]|uniref:EI24 domain-containing protein n=1 Tax=Desulfosarcina sp. BuS5 TaxID=933262 RepID=UPI000481D33D|nr:EI24 domain-containing protein [Desulfosarcina sp. BuS5]WDN89179.1 CysZ protein [Desulfosarcina sp. BuS5]